MSQNTKSDPPAPPTTADLVESVAVQNAADSAPAPPAYDTGESHAGTSDLGAGNNATVDYGDAPTPPSISDGHDESIDISTQENTAPHPPTLNENEGSNFVDGNAAPSPPN